MSVKFQPAKRENVGLWINLIGGTGSGKTFTALRLASGIAGDKPFAFIDTENRRGLHYADQFKFDYAELREPFRPDAYVEAVIAADQAGYPVIVIDSGSHVWAGSGGILDWQEEELNRMAGDDWKKRERVKMAAWIKPKMSHKKFVQKLLQVKAHIIFCLRAEEKIEMVQGSDGKLEIRQKQSLAGRDGWLPVCEKNLPFEATCSFLLLADNPGVPHPIKLQEQHKALFPLDTPVTEESGRKIAEWAAGGVKPKANDFAANRAAMIEYFGELGVEPKLIFSAVRKTSIDEIGEDDVTKLRAIASDIKNNSTTVAEAFPTTKAATTEDPARREPADEAGPLESKRADVQAALDELSKSAQKNVLAGRKSPKDCDDAELLELMDEIAKYA